MSELMQFTTEQFKTIRLVEHFYNSFYDSPELPDCSAVEPLDLLFSVEDTDLFGGWLKYGSCHCDRCNPTWNASIKRIRFRRKTRNFNNQIKRIREKRGLVSSSSSSSSSSKDL